MIKKGLLYILLLLTLSACGFVHEERLTGKYYLIAVDAMEDMSVSYYNRELDVFQGIGGNGVYEVGYDDHFIITKKYKELNTWEYDKTVTEYYLIPVDNIQESWKAQENYFGPLTKQEFEAKRKELGVPDAITFKKIR